MSGFSRALCRVLYVAAVLAASPGAANEPVSGVVRMAALTLESDAPLREHPRSEPFRARFMPGPQSPLAMKWRSALQTMRRDLSILEACRSEPDACAGPAGAVLSMAHAARTRQGRARIGTINRAVNLAIRPSDDAVRFGAPDRWTSPLETLGDARGDCEDYAIAKYALLREAGFAESDLRLVIVRLPRARVDHAVLAVRHEGRWLILDNRRFAMLDAEHFADEALFVLRGDADSGVAPIQADTGAEFSTMPLVM